MLLNDELFLLGNEHFEGYEKGGEEMSTGDMVLTVGVIIIIYIVGAYCGYNVGVEEHKKQAVKAGHAEYYIDKDFDKRWRWKGK